MVTKVDNGDEFQNEFQNQRNILLVRDEKYDQIGV